MVRLFIAPHPRKTRVSQVTVERPFGKLNLRNELRLEPLTVLHFAVCQIKRPRSAPLLWKVHERTLFSAELLQ